MPATTTNSPAKNTRSCQSTLRERAASAARARPPSARRRRASRRPRARRRRAPGRRTARARRAPCAASTRSIAGLGGERSASGPARQLLAEQPDEHAPRWPPGTRAPTGRVSARYCAKPIVPCAAAPTIMFCGLPREADHAADVRRRREREQVRQRRQPGLDDDRDDERREQHADGVVEQQRRQRPGDEGQARTAATAPSARGSARGTRTAGRTAPPARYAAISSTPNSSIRTWRSIACERGVHRQAADHDHRDRADHRARRAIEADPVQLAARDDEVGQRRRRRASRPLRHPRYAGRRRSGRAKTQSRSRTLRTTCRAAGSSPSPSSPTSPSPPAS